LLRSPLTDWDQIYVRVRCSPMGVDYPAERFLRTPISTLRWLLRQIDDAEQAKANLASITTARLTQLVVQVAHGFSGSKRAAPKVKPNEFLPFPDWKPASTEVDGPDQPTKFILSELIRTRQIPLHVFATLNTPAE
jgi:hypothetical protein